ncbi:MAG: hypothetical protein ACYC6G_18430 [Desulfobaccales bacterium]
MTLSLEGREQHYKHPELSGNHHLKLAVPVKWGKPQPEGWESVVGLTITNTAKSGDGQVSLSLGPGSVQSADLDLIEWMKGYNADKMLAWHGSKPSTPSFPQGNHASPFVIKDKDESLPLRLDLRFYYAAIKKMHRQTVPLTVTIPIKYKIAPDTAKENPSALLQGESSLILEFLLERYLGPDYLVIDYGTSAVAIGYEGFTDQLMKSDHQGNQSLHSLLDLQGMFLEKGADAPDREEWENNPEQGTRFIQSVGSINAQIRGGMPGFFQVPLIPHDIRHVPEFAVPFLKMLIGRSLQEVELGQKITYIDPEGNQHPETYPPLRETILSAYKYLRQEYIDPYLRKEGQLEDFDKLIITHPNTFSLRHEDYLRGILKEVFSDQDEILMISESDASAIYYLYREHELRQAVGAGPIPETERVFVYDIGAGTVDITYLEIERRAEKNPRISYKGKLGLPMAGNWLDTLIARFVHRKLLHIRDRSREGGSAFSYGDEIVQVTPLEIAPKTRTHMLYFWYGILAWKKAYAEWYAEWEKNHPGGGAPPDHKIPLKLGERGAAIIDILDFATNADHYRNLGMYLDDKEAPWLEISTREIWEDPALQQWIEFIGEWILEDFFKGRNLGPGQVPLDAVMISGRTAEWPGMKRKINESLKRLARNPEAIFRPEIPVVEKKVAVSFGALIYAILWKDWVEFEDRNIWGRYGLIYNAPPGQRTFKDLFPAEGDGTNQEKQWPRVQEKGRTIYMPQGTVEIDLSFASHLDVVYTFLSDPEGFIQSGRYKEYEEQLLISVSNPLPKAGFGKNVRRLTCQAEVNRDSHLNISFTPKSGNPKGLAQLAAKFGALTCWPINPVFLK